MSHLFSTPVDEVKKWSYPKLAEHLAAAKKIMQLMFGSMERVEGYFNEVARHQYQFRWLQKA